MGNIVGEGFDPYVIEQIKTRQEILGSPDKNYEQLVWENAKTSFVKLVASTDITNLQTVDANGKITNQGIFGGGFTRGSQLAEKYVLFNGVVNETPREGVAELIQRFGIDNSSVATNNGAYGLGGSDFGLQPMPGIISANIKTEARGSLKTGTIQIKANNKIQFEIISTLYLKLGYMMLLEWGNSTYFKNKDTFIGDNRASLADGFLTGKYNYNSILGAIEEKRKSTEGNYDALVGKVVNYSWNFNRDGSYDITLVIRSQGDVIEALKTNVLLSNVAPPSTSGTSGSSGTSGNAGFNTVDPNRGYASPDSIIVAFAYAHQIGKKFADIQYELGQKTRGANGMKVIDGGWGNKRYVDYFSQEYNNNRVEYYVRFGEFLDFLKNAVIPNVTNGGKLIDFDDVNSDSILHYSPPRQISSDPRICIFKYTLKDKYYVAGDAEDCIRNIGNNDYVKLMFVYINFVFILKVLEDLKGTDGKVVLIDFLNGILEGYCKATGNINNITARIDTDTNKIIFIDETSFPDRESLSVNKETAKFNVYGLKNGGSFVRDMQLKTEITPELANMITIGSTANGYVTGQDSTMLSNLNKGTKDRIKPTITSPNDGNGKQAEDNKTTEEQYEATLKAYGIFNETISSQGNTTIPIWDENAFSNFSNTQVQLLEYDQQHATQELRKTNKWASSPNSGFLPFNLTLTMDGLAGMKIYQKYTIDQDFLPSNYPETMDFVIKGVSNQIQNNVWTTTIESLAIPKYSSASKGKSQPTNPTDPVNPSVSTTNPQSPIVADTIKNTSNLRNAIVRIAKSYVGQSEIDAVQVATGVRDKKGNLIYDNINDNKGFKDKNFENKMKGVGWFSDNSQLWCNYFVNLVWKEAYAEVGAKEPTIASINSNIFKNFKNTYNPLSAGTKNSFAQMKQLGYAQDFVKSTTLPQPGDLIVYNAGHISICGKVDAKKRTYESIDGNSNSNASRNGGAVSFTAARRLDGNVLDGILGIITVPEKL
jgi:hypothetical protein